MRSQASQPNIHRDMAVTTIRVDREVLNRLRVIARAEHLSINQTLRRMIDEQIALADAKEAEAA